MKKIHLISLLLGNSLEYSDPPCISGHQINNTKHPVVGFPCTKFADEPDDFFDMKNSATNLSFWLHSSGNVLGIDASTNNAATFPSNWSDINSIYVRRSNTSEVSGAVRIVLELVDTSCGTPAFKEKCLTADAVPDEILDNADPNNVTVTVPNSGIPFKWRGCQYNRQNTSQDFLTDAIGAGSSVPTSTGGSVPVGLPTLKNFPASVSMSSSSRSVRSTGIGSFSPAVSTSGSPSTTTTSGSPPSTTSDSPSITSDSPKKSTSGSDSSSSTSDSDFSSSTGDSDSPSSTSGSPSSTSSSGSPSISGSPSSTSSSGSPSTTSYSLSTITIDPPSTTAVSTGSSVSPTGIRARNLIMKNFY